MTLYHYCCSCSRRRITDRGFLRPSDGAALFGVELVWLADQAVPDREGLGLTSNTLRCDRLEHQYIVNVRPDEVHRWLTSDVRRSLTFNLLNIHEFEEGRAPETWWIATKPIFAVRNRAYEVSRATNAVRLSVGDPGVPLRAKASSCIFVYPHRKEG